MARGAAIVCDKRAHAICEYLKAELGSCVLENQGPQKKRKKRKSQASCVRSEDSLALDTSFVYFLIFIFIFYTAYVCVCVFMYNLGNACARIC